MRPRAIRAILPALALSTLPALVRADAPANQYEAYLSGDDFVEDKQTGCRWWRRAPDTPVALAQVACPSPATFRVPTLRELATLLDNQPRQVLVGGVSKPLHIDQNAFPRTPPDVFWTATVAPDGKVFVIDFGSGEIRTQTPGTPAYLRCIQRVRPPS